MLNTLFAGATYPLRLSKPAVIKSQTGVLPRDPARDRARQWIEFSLGDCTIFPFGGVADPPRGFEGGAKWLRCTQRRQMRS
jgi:hypothetical protein